MRKKAGLSEIAALRRIAAKTYTRITDGNRKAGADGMSAPVFPCFAYGRKNDGKRRSNSDEKIMKVWNMRIHPIRRTGERRLRWIARRRQTRSFISTSERNTIFIRARDFPIRRPKISIKKRGGIPDKA